MEKSKVSQHLCPPPLSLLNRLRFDIELGVVLLFIINIAHLLHHAKVSEIPTQWR